MASYFLRLLRSSRGGLTGIFMMIIWKKQPTPAVITNHTVLKNKDRQRFQIFLYKIWLIYGLSLCNLVRTFAMNQLDPNGDWIMAVRLNYLWIKWYLSSFWKFQINAEKWKNIYFWALILWNAKRFSNISKRWDYSTIYFLFTVLQILVGGKISWDFTALVYKKWYKISNFFQLNELFFIPS